MATKNTSTAPVMATPSPEGQSLRVPTSKVVVGKDWNSRQFMAESAVDVIADSFKKQGQITPVRLSPRPDGKYDLVSGFTRFAAAKKLGWDTIDATVSNQPMSDEQRRIENLVENEVRKDLTPYEQAYAYLALSQIPTEKDAKKMAYSQQAIADLAGKSQSYVSRLISATELLAPAVLKQWAKDCEAMANGDDKHTPIVTVQYIKALVKFDHKEQLAWLDEAIAGKPETDDEGDGDNVGGGEDDKPDTTPRTSFANIKRALAAAEATLKDAKNVGEKSYADGVIAALKFTMKAGRTIDGVCKVKDGKVVTLKGEGIAAPRKEGGKAKVVPAAQASA